MRSPSLSRSPVNHDGCSSSQEKPKGVVQRKLILMSLLICIMFLGELFGGLKSGSLALVSDAFHMLNDGMSLLVALFCMKLSDRKSSSGMSFGWERAEILGGLINGIALIIVCSFIFVEAIQRFINPPEIENPMLVIAIGIASLFFNIVGICIFHDGHSHGGHGHSHGGGHGHHDEDMNVRAIFLHVLVGFTIGSFRLGF